MVDAGLSRGVINQRVGRIKRVFKWAVAEELVPEPVHRALLAVEGLKAGRSAARETDRVEPVPDGHVDAVLPFLSGPLRAMVRAQRLTGMRPGEAALMRGCDLDTTGAVWVCGSTAKIASSRTFSARRRNPSASHDARSVPSCSAISVTRSPGGSRHARGRPRRAEARRDGCRNDPRPVASAGPPRPSPRGPVVRPSARRSSARSALMVVARPTAVEVSRRGSAGTGRKGLPNGSETTAPRRSNVHPPTSIPAVTIGG